MPAELRKTHSFTSPLRYPGGKGMLADFVKLLLSDNEMLDSHYVEVYAGGAAIAWELLFEEYVQHVHLNDISVPLCAFWKSVLDSPEALCRLITDTRVTIKEWYRQKAVQSRPGSHSDLELGFSTFFLNRTNRSGILNGGVIGGKSQAGKWKIDARFNKRDLISRIAMIARYRSRVSLYNEDAVDFIRGRLPKIPRRSLVYLDPPYYTKGQSLYEDHYSHQDHVEIAELIRSFVTQPWVLTYDNTPEIRALYRGYPLIQYDLSYSAQDRYAGSEVAFFSERLQVPATPSPASVRLRKGARPSIA